jgi:polyisoprenoid-binding protein YceI
MNAKYYLAICCTLIIGPLSAQPRSMEMLKSGSFVTYRLHHPLHDMESTSKDVVCVVNADTTTKEIKSVTAQVDVMTFNSGNSNRDSHAMEVIDAITYPDADFASTSIAQNADSLKVTGKMTFHGVTNNIVIPAVCKWSADTITVRGQFDLSLTEFKIDRPSLLLMPVDDALKFSFVAVFVLK